MTTVKCPICKDRVSAANTDELNASFREHLANVHNMRDLIQGPRGGTYPAGRYMEKEERREGTMERMGETVQPSRRRYDVVRDYPYVENRPDIGFSGSESRTEREVETWSSRDPARFRSEYYIPREEVRQWRYPVTGQYGERGPYYEREAMRGTEERYERRGSEMNAVINCPMCGAMVRGRDESDLSDELRDHMMDVHDIRPKMTARF